MLSDICGSSLRLYLTSQLQNQLGVNVENNRAHTPSNALRIDYTNSVSCYFNMSGSSIGGMLSCSLMESITLKTKDMHYPTNL